MKKVTAELDWGTVEGIVLDELTDMLQDLKQNLAHRKTVGFAIFDIDEEKDIIEIQRHIDAFEVVMHYITIEK